MLTSSVANPDEIAAELYEYAREAWDVWSDRAGWRGRIDHADAVQVAVAHCWAVHDRHDPQLSSRRTFFTLCARRAITSISTMQRAAKRQARELSLDVTYQDGDPALLLHDPTPGGCELVEHSDELDHLRNLVQALPERERHVIEQRHVHGRTLAEVGVDLGVSRERVRQIEAKALRKLTATLTRDRVQLT